MNRTKEHIQFKALSEEIRLRIVVLLIAGEACVCDLTEVLRLPQSTISRHLSKLKSAGIIHDRRAGKWVYYALNRSENSFTRAVLNSFEACTGLEPYQADLERLLIYRKNKTDKSCKG